MSNDLKRQLASPDLVIAPGIYDALSALLAERAGFTALYLSGAAIAYTKFGRPDIGLVDMGEVASTLANIAERVDVPVIVDGDTGFGNALNVQRTVRRFERAGAAAIQIEDQTMPKRCGHLKGKTLVSTGEMTGKIKAALDARSSDDFLVVARTDAVAVEGLDAALDRARAYAEAGADMLFVEALRTEEDMRRACRELGPLAPMMANMVEGGQTPIRGRGELADIGYSLAIFPGGTVRAAAKFLAGYFESLQATGTTDAYRDRMYEFDDLQKLVGTGEMVDLGRKYDG